MTAKEIANKWHPDSDYDDCRNSCMSCDGETCDRLEYALLHLQRDVEEAMKERAIEFAEFWASYELEAFWDATDGLPEGYYLDAEEAYNEKYKSDE